MEGQVDGQVERRVDAKCGEPLNKLTAMVTPRTHARRRECTHRTGTGFPAGPWPIHD
ncbi:hypothetical protein AKJ09_02888 [Labilithrix luteola]|uniref:Uncharacterized protein n=1 Tax=Labilithrix luteola TaxID=1391654 RepID=A0A0K1PSY7_9BACT|nr:hypothetical protein AKJ09_02888 [Labilithrix luteola]